MPWCPVCNEVQTTYPNTVSEPVAVPTRSDRYNSDGEYIGYEEGESHQIRIRTIPTCPGCNTKFEFPSVKSKEEYFHAKKNALIGQLRARMPGRPEGLGWGCIAGVVVAAIFVTLIFVTQATDKEWLAILVTLAVAIGAGYLAWRINEPNEKDIAKCEAERRGLQNKVATLQSMQFSETSYQRLRSEQW